MAANASINHGQLVKLLLEYGQRVRDIQERAWTYSHPSYVEKGLPLLLEAIKQWPQLSQGTVSTDSKAQKELMRSLAEKAKSYADEVQPLVTSLKVISQNFTSIAQLLAELHRVLGSLTLRSYPDLLHQYMETFCGAVKAGLLLENLPRRAAAKMAQLASEHVDTETAAKLLKASQDKIYDSSSVVAYLRDLFNEPSGPQGPNRNAIKTRIAQVLELVVGPALSVSDSCDDVASAGLLVMPDVLEPSGVGHDACGAYGIGANAGDGGAEASPAMGMYGMTRGQVYPFLRHRESIRQWGLLGFIVFPDILSHVGSAQRLTMLLADGFALHIYKDRITCAHQLVLQHVGPTAAAALGGGAPVSPRSTGSPSSGRLGAIFGKGMAIIGGASRLRKSQTGEADAQEQASVHPLLVDAACSAVKMAPIQHRMWRAYLTGQLRNMHALCSAAPLRIPGQIEMVLAALSLAREELLWFVRHDSRKVPPELVPILSARGLLENGQMQAIMPSDTIQVLELLSAMDALHRLLVEHHCVLSKQIKEAIGADLQAHVVPCTPRVEFRLKQAAASATVSKGSSASPSPANAAAGVQPFKDLTDLLRSVLTSSTPPADVAVRVSNACGIWLYVSLQLASNEPPLKAAKVLQYAEDTRYLDVLQKGLDASRLLHERPLLHASAMDLAPGLQYLMEPLLKAAEGALRSGCMEHMQAALGAMQGLHWLLPHQIDTYPATMGSTNSGNLQRMSSNIGLGRNSTDTAAQSRPGTSRGLPPSQSDELPKRCMNMVVMCIRRMLAPVVKAPLASVASLNALARSTAPSLHGDISLKSRPPSGALAKAASARLKLGDVPSTPHSGSGYSSRATTPERQRTGANDTPTAEDVVRQCQEQPAPCDVEDAHGWPAAWNTALPAMPAAPELVARLLPLVLALDSGRMLNGGASGRAAGGLIVCRSKLVEAVRENLTELLANTAAAIGQVTTPLPSVHFAPLRRFVEVVSMLQPQLATELLPEVARLLLQQSCAPTVQTVGLETAISVGSRSAPSTSAQVAPSTAPNFALLTPSAVAGSTTGALNAGGLGPLARSLSINAPSTRGGSGGGSDRAAGPMMSALPHPSGSLPTASSIGTTTVLRALHSWLWSTIVLDERRSGVAYDAEAGGFTAGGAIGASAALSGLTAATSVRELAMCFEIFGPCAVADLTRGSDELLRNCLQQLEVFLEANSAPLQELLDAARLPVDKRMAAVQAAMPNLVSPPGFGGGGGPAGLGSLVDVLQCLGRCIQLRMQLGRAAVTAAERTTDFVTLALQEMAAPIGVETGSKVVNAGYNASNDCKPEVMGAGCREWCSLLQLATAGTRSVESSYGGCLMLDRADPLLTMHLAALVPTLAAAQRWHKLPALLAALMAAPQWGAGITGTAHAPSRGPSSKGLLSPEVAMDNQAVAVTARFLRMSVVSSAAVALSLSLQSAVSQVLHPAAGQFLLGCDSPAAAMLCTYQRIACTVVQAAAQGGGSENAAGAKQQMLGSLERLPLLHGYSYRPLYADGAVLLGPCEDSEGPVDESTSPSTGSIEHCHGDGSSSQASRPTELDGREPSLIDGRWASELDGWRPSARLLPLVLGQVG